MATDYLEAMEILAREGWSFLIYLEGHRIKIIALNGERSLITVGDTLVEAIWDVIKDGGP